MLCKIEGCGRAARYKAACLCQKHYFRVRRNGTTELKGARPRYEDDRGYQFIHAPNHPLLARGQNYIGEHRALLYGVIGPDPMACELCWVGLTWKTCQVDHIDENPRNNALTNLRPLCRRCNVWRNMPPAHLRMPQAQAITFDGETKTPHEWSHDSRVSVTAACIRYRKRSGMSDAEALFAPKVTHNGRQRKPAPRKTQHKHERSNAVRVTVDGITRTAAEWSKHSDCQVTDTGLIYRIKAGWDHKRAVFQPARAIASKYRAMRKALEKERA